MSCDTATESAVLYGASGSAVGSGAVLGTSDLVSIADGEGLALGIPSALRPGEADGALVLSVSRYGEFGVENGSVVALAAATVAAGGRLGPEDGRVLWQSPDYQAMDLTAEGDWDGDGRPDLAWRHGEGHDQQLDDARAGGVRAARPLTHLRRVATSPRPR